MIKLRINWTWMEHISTQLRQYMTTMVSIILNEEKLNTLPFRTRTKHGCSPSPLLFSIDLLDQILTCQHEQVSAGLALWRSWQICYFFVSSFVFNEITLSY